MAVPLFGQTSPDLDQGLKPYGAFQNGNIDSVNLADGNVNLHIPLFSLPQRGGKLNLPFEVSYNNKGWYIYQSGTTKQWKFGGLTGTVHVILAQSGMTSKTALIKTKDLYGNTVLLAHYSVQSPDGSSHEVGITDNTNVGMKGSGETMDGTAIWDGITTGILGVIDSNGVKGWLDPNGNYLSTSTTGWTDTLGRNIPGTTPSDATYGSFNGGILNLGTPSSTANCPSGTASALALNLPGYNGLTTTYKFCFADFNYQTNFNLVPVLEAAGTIRLMNAVVLPNLTSWKFTYNSYLDLTSITFPTGGSITYSWANYSLVQNSESRCITQRVLNDGTSTHTTKYQYDLSINGAISNLVTDPANNDTVLAPCFSGYVCKAQYYTGPYNTGTLLKTVTTQYSLAYENPYDTYTNQQTYLNVLPTSETITWPNGKTMQTTTTYDPGFTYYIYDPNLDQADTYTAYYGVPTLKTFSDYGQGAPGTIIKQVSTSYKWQSDSNYLNANLLNLVSSTKTLNGSGIKCAETDYDYDNANYLTGTTITMQHQAAPGPKRGNLSSISQQLTSTPCQASASWRPITSYVNSYDTGTTYQSVDPLGHLITYSYSTTFYGAYATQTQSNSTATPGVSGSVTHITTSNYDFNTGLKTSATDENSRTTGLSYDTMFRLTQTSFPDGGQLSFTYHDSPAYGVTVTRKLTSAVNQITTASVDGVGRLVQTQLVDPNCTVGSGLVKTDIVHTEDTTAHDFLTKTSTPYCDTPGTNYGLQTVNHLDTVGRTKSVVQTDGSAVSTIYSGNQITVTDEAGRLRTTQTDSLGRLTTVWEDPGTSPHLNYETDYSYDPLGNLLSVNQKGSALSDSTQWRTRTFTYDSLSRLLSAANPESGTTTYTYNDDGTLATKTTPKQNQTNPATTVTATYAYDEIHRLESKTFSDGSTPKSSYVYDGVALPGCTLAGPTDLNPKPNRTSMCNTADQSVWTHDAVGRATQEWDCLFFTSPSCVIKSVVYTYNFVGGVTSTNYIGGFTISQSFDSIGRPSQITSTISDAYHPSPLATVDSAVGYWPNGALRKIAFGNGVYEDTAYDKRLKICRSNVNSVASYTLATCADSLPGTGNLQDLNFAYNLGTSDNGNVASMVGTGTQNFNRGYGYDSLNRLSTFTDSASAQTCKGLSLSYDAWGSRTDQSVTAGSCYTFHAVPNTQNQLVDVVNHKYAYDAAGNMIQDASHTYFYDAENRLIQVDGSSGYCLTQTGTAAAACYSYDPMGQRVAKSTGATSVHYLHDLTGHVLVEQDQNQSWLADYIYMGGALIAEYKSGITYFVHKDHLGSTRILTDTNKAIAQSLDFGPFGELWTSDSGVTTHKFTSTERDGESGLDNFAARYYSSNLGRFMNADWSAKPASVPYAEFGDPQSLNLYAYVRNNPLNRTDLDGHCWPFCDLALKAIDAFSAFAARHPRVGEAFDKLGTSGHARVDVGAGGNVPEKLSPASGGAQVTAYAKTAQEGPEVGVSVQGTGRIGPYGLKAQVDSAVVKDGEWVNPAKNTSFSVTPVIGAEQNHVDGGVSGNQEEASLGASYSEGVVAGFEYSNEGIGDLGSAILDGIISDVKDIMTTVKEFPFVTSSDKVKEIVHPAFQVQ